MGQDRLSLKIGGIKILLRSKNFSFQQLAEAFHQFTCQVASPDLTLDVTSLPWKDRKFRDLKPSCQALFSCFDRYYRRMYCQSPIPKEFDKFIESQLDWLAGYFPSAELERRLRDYDEKDTWLCVQAYRVQDVTGVGLLFLEQGGNVGEVFLPRLNDHNAPFLAVISLITKHAYSVVVHQRNGLLLHSAGVAKDSKCCLFAGLPGSGKTTVARLSRDLTVLADDSIPVRRTGDSFYASSTPWNFMYPPWDGSFSEVLEDVRIERLFFLNRGSGISFKKLTPAESVARLIRHVILSLVWANHYDAKEGHKVFELCSQLCRVVPCYDMYFSLGEDFWGEISKLP